MGDKSQEQEWNHSSTNTFDDLYQQQLQQQHEFHEQQFQGHRGFDQQFQENLDFNNNLMNAIHDNFLKPSFFAGIIRNWVKQSTTLHLFTAVYILSRIFDFEIPYFNVLFFYFFIFPVVAFFLFYTLFLFVWYKFFKLANNMVNNNNNNNN